MVFKIIEGNKYKIKNINFNGNDSFLKSKLLDSFSNTKERRWYKFWQGDYNVSDFETDIQNLELFYKNNGYRDVQIISKNIDFSDNDFLA